MKDVDEHDDTEWIGSPDDDAQTKTYPGTKTCLSLQLIRIPVPPMMDAQTDGVVENAAIGFGDLTVVRNMEGSTLYEPLEERKVADDDMVCFIVLLREYRQTCP